MKFNLYSGPKLHLIHGESRELWTIYGTVQPDNIRSNFRKLYFPVWVVEVASAALT